MPKRTQNDKLRELILYVAKRSEGDPAFGATKLNKILFYADFISYRRTGKSITGQEYHKLPKGPAPRHLKPVLDQLIGEGAIAVQHREHFGFMQKRIVALREPHLNLFTGQEIAIVEEVLASIQGLNARDVSDLSHEFIGWKVVEIGDTIPYETALVWQDPLTQEQLNAFGLTEDSVKAGEADMQAGRSKPLSIVLHELRSKIQR